MGAFGGGGGGATAYQVEQRWVGYLIGRGGGVCKEVETETGVKVSIDQSTQSLGYSTINFSGSDMSMVEAAVTKLSFLLSKVGGSLMAAEGGQPSAGGGKGTGRASRPEVAQ